MTAANNGTIRPHLLLLHTIKTGGSSVECAAQAMERRGGWSNMGHTTHGSVQHCLASCTFRGVRPQIVLSIREPYEYYHSLYTYAYSGTGMPKTHLAFEDFMKTYVEKAAPTPKAHYRYSQATRITRVCGTPCNYDYLLRTESLTQDWAALLKAMRIPLREAAASLPRLNPTTTKRGGAKPVIFTRRVLDIIDRADGMLFDLFGYARRTQCRSTGPRASLETRIARIPF